MASAQKDKHTTYPELVDSAVLRLVVVASEIGGRMSTDATKLIRAAAAFRARDEPALLRSAVFRSLCTRWTTMVSVAAQEAVAATLVDEGTTLLEAADGPAPESLDLWLDADR